MRRLLPGIPQQRAGYARVQDPITNRPNACHGHQTHISGLSASARRLLTGTVASRRLCFVIQATTGGANEGTGSRRTRIVDSPTDATDGIKGMLPRDPSRPRSLHPQSARAVFLIRLAAPMQCH
jgi:hypothetical protein